MRRRASSALVRRWEGRRRPGPTHHPSPWQPPAVTHHEYIEVSAATALNASFLDASAEIAAQVVKVCARSVDVH